MRGKRRLVVLAGLLAALGLQAMAFGGVIRADRSDSQYLSLAADPAYGAVGRFDGKMGSSGFIASGTLVSPNWVLTAGHVVDHTTSLRFTIGGSTYAADKWLAFPSWNGDLMAGYDIGLVRLVTPVLGITPAKRYTGSSELGKVDTAVGYGMTGTGTTGAKTFDGKKRAEQNTVDRIQNGRILLSDFDNPKNVRDNRMGSATPLNLEGLIAPGDSGGGVFLTTSAGTFLAGVNSFAGAYDGKVDSDYGDISGAIRVSAFNSWIDSTIGASTAPATRTVSSSSSGYLRTTGDVPEPGALGLLAVAGLVALFGWRRLHRR